MAQRQSSLLPHPRKMYSLHKRAVVLAPTSMGLGAVTYGLLYLMLIIGGSGPVDAALPR
jgi:hypothetical protein